MVISRPCPPGKSPSYPTAIPILLTLCHRKSHPPMRGGIGFARCRCPRGADDPLHAAKGARGARRSIQCGGYAVRGRSPDLPASAGRGWRIFRAPGKRMNALLCGIVLYDRSIYESLLDHLSLQRVTTHTCRL